MDNWTVYILKGNRYYIWSTNNLERRLGEHLRWKTHTTQRLWEIINLYWYIECSDKKQARSLEKMIKKWWHYDRWITKNKDVITIVMGL
jgi:predicted GIY-YIG superfamily endonuclease